MGIDERADGIRHADASPPRRRRVLRAAQSSMLRGSYAKQNRWQLYAASGITYGGAAENRTPVHESPLIGISRLSRSFDLGRVARSDTLAASQPVRS